MTRDEMVEKFPRQVGETAAEYTDRLMREEQRAFQVGIFDNAGVQGLFDSQGRATGYAVVMPELSAAPYRYPNNRLA